VCCSSLECKQDTVFVTLHRLDGWRRAQNSPLRWHLRLPRRHEERQRQAPSAVRSCPHVIPHRAGALCCICNLDACVYTFTGHGNMHMGKTAQTATLVFAQCLLGILTNPILSLPPAPSPSQTPPFLSPLLLLMCAGRWPIADGQDTHHGPQAQGGAPACALPRWIH